MSLHDINKAERRARILTTAKRLIGARSFDGLTMRDLADASRVSVPTIYNLIGGKPALLAALLQDQYAAIATGFAAGSDGDSIDRALAIHEAAYSELFDAPAYSRQCVQHFLASGDSDPLRQRVDDMHIAVMTGVLVDARRDGHLEAWVEPTAIATALYAHFTMQMIAWAKGEIDDDQMRALSTYGACAILLGVTCGEARAHARRRMEDVQPNAHRGPMTLRRGA